MENYRIRGIVEDIDVFSDEFFATVLVASGNKKEKLSLYGPQEFGHLFVIGQHICVEGLWVHNALHVDCIFDDAALGRNFDCADNTTAIVLSWVDKNAHNLQTVGNLLVDADIEIESFSFNKIKNGFLINVTTNAVAEQIEKISTLLSDLDLEEIAVEECAYSVPGLLDETFIESVGYDNSLLVH